MAHKATAAAIKVGNRVTVKELPDDHPLKRLSGRRGEVVQVGKGVHHGREDSATHPDGDEELVLVDDQYVNGKPNGVCSLREWFSAGDLEVG